jgi:hypothetical protein
LDKLRIRNLAKVVKGKQDKKQQLGIQAGPVMTGESFRAMFGPKGKFAAA